MIFSLPIAFALGVSVLATSFLSGLFGMAGGMVLMGLLLIMLPVPAAMVLHGVTQMASNGWRAWLWRAHVRWPVFGGYVAGAAISLAAFTLIRLSPDKAAVLIFLGLTPLAALAIPVRWAPNVMCRGHSFACGLICSSLQLVAGVSGPLLDSFFVKSGLDRKAIVATKAVSQTFGHFLKLVYFGGIIASDESYLPAWVMGVAVVMAVVGTTASRQLLERMSDLNFRVWSQRLIATMAVIYLGQGLWLLIRP